MTWPATSLRRRRRPRRQPRTRQTRPQPEKADTSNKSDQLKEYVREVTGFEHVDPAQPHADHAPQLDPADAEANELPETRATRPEGQPPGPEALAGRTTEGVPEIDPASEEGDELPETGVGPEPSPDRHGVMQRVGDAFGSAAEKVGEAVKKAGAVVLDQVTASEPTMDALGTATEHFGLPPGAAGLAGILWQGGHELGPPAEYLSIKAQGAGAELADKAGVAVETAGAGVDKVAAESS